MHKLNKNIGDFGEELAVKLLMDEGYIILDRNFRCKMGEIDIIAKDSEHIAFIEVKTRYSNYYGSPGEAVTFQKQNKILRAAQMFILKNKLKNLNYRFDVVEILVNINQNKHEIKLIKNAFQL